MGKSDAWENLKKISFAGLFGVQCTHHIPFYLLASEVIQPLDGGRRPAKRKREGNK